MAFINFPSNPTDGQPFEHQNKRWIWDATYSRWLVDPVSPGGTSEGGDTITEVNNNPWWYDTSATAPSAALLEKAVAFTYNNNTAPTVYVKATGGATHVTMIRWDGTRAIKALAGGGAATALSGADWGTAIASPYNVASNKFAAIFPSDSGYNPVGSFLTVDMNTTRITSLSIGDSSQLTHFTADNCRVEHLDFSDFHALQFLSLLSAPLLQTLKTPTSPSALKGISLGSSRIETLDLRYAGALEAITVGGNPNLHTLYLSSNGYPALTTLTLTENAITSLANWPLCPLLTEIYVNDNPIAGPVSFAFAPNVSLLDAYNTSITEITSSFGEVGSIDLNNSELEQIPSFGICGYLNASYCNLSGTVDISGAELGAVNLSHNNISVLYCDYANVPISIIAHNNPALSELYLNYTELGGSFTNDFSYTNLDHIAWGMAATQLATSTESAVIDISNSPAVPNVASFEATLTGKDYTLVY